MGCERDEYPSHVGTETRRSVRAGTATTVNGPGSLRTERVAIVRRREIADDQ
jgi:hypothetical protein